MIDLKETLDLMARFGAVLEEETGALGRLALTEAQAVRDRKAELARTVELRLRPIREIRERTGSSAIPDEGQRMEFLQAWSVLQKSMHENSAALVRVQQAVQSLVDTLVGTVRKHQHRNLPTYAPAGPNAAVMGGSSAESAMIALAYDTRL